MLRGQHIAHQRRVLSFITLRLARYRMLRRERSLVFNGGLSHSIPKRAQVAMNRSNVNGG